MNKMKNIKISALLLAIVLSTSCQKFLDVNTDPNNPTTSKLSLTLSAGTVWAATAQGDFLSSTCGYFSQYWTGRPGIALQNLDRHEYPGAVSNNPWSFYYARGLADLNFVAKSSEPLYSGIAKLLLAYHFQVLTDCFGDVPYSEAFKGEIADGSNVSPKFDDDVEIYKDLIVKIDEAISDLNTTVPGMLVPGDDDVIYGGDINKWIQFANSLKLKIYIRQANTDAASVDAIKQKFADIWANEPLILSNTDACFVPFTGGTNSFNPLFAGDRGAPAFTGCETSVKFLELTADPRIQKFYNQVTSGVYKGIPYGDVENQPTNEALFSNFKTPTFVYKSSAPVILISAYEVYFILAEAAARGWISDPASLFYDNAVKLNFDYLGFSETDADSYLGSSGAYDATDLNSQLKSIAIQKWIAFNGLQNVESWIEVRRFDTPSQTIFRGVGGIFRSPTRNSMGDNNFPSILLYSDNELSFNANAPAQHSLTNRVFWDN